jgi:hypothetical protein
MGLPSSVIAPSAASRRPSTRVVAPTVMPTSTISVPVKRADAPIVADPPTTQNTLQACASLISATVVEAAIVSAPPIWKMKTASGRPSASRVSVPPENPIAAGVP